ncbi:MAG: sulfurase [Euryarchaeota archaeon]|nr:sulfurase [Euryarchaeota archaeon]|tara:strand:- start:491 stop:958 length:468 start_codon:yes stop_codon:yes gene_type:complete
MGVIHSVNVSENGGVPKLPIRAATIRFEGVEGDHNKFRTEKKGGDPGRAVNLFSLERIEQLQAEGHAIEVGSTGENLTIEGVEWDELEVGVVLKIGSAMVELSEPCAPCWKIGDSFNSGNFSRIDHDKEVGWSRWSARVVEEGLVSVGDSVQILP